MAGEKGAVYSSDILKLVFNSTALSWNAATNLYLSLHTADPGVGGSQTTNEAAYTGYARTSLTRSGTSAFTVSTSTVAANSVVLAAGLSFPSCTGGSSTVTYFAIGISSTGAGELLYAGPVSPTIAVSSGVTPQLTTGTAITES